MKRRITALTLAAATALTLAACSSGGGDSSGGAGTEPEGLSLDAVQDAGVLVVGTEGTYRPFTFHEGGSGDLTGFDVEIVTAVAEKLGVDVEFQETQWDAIFAGLESGRFDVIANQVSINDEREEKYDFSEPYTISPGVLIAPADTDITSFEDLEGRTTAQSLTSNWYEVAEGFGANVEAVEGWAQAVELLRQGRVDATVNDELTFLDFEKTEGADDLKVVAETEDASRNALTFRKGSTDLVEAVNDALAELRADGTLAEISEKYFGADVTQ
ncbi:cystine transport system substrate-binding protein [Diaminobutyricimonas aerilata]|uniref:Cystine transport system substrate-binding protein n=1 Tax=Diaminobutyricimonas aerilata TaxID=1162967 RepID=A0A2M9CH10_9MICO|nr:amino acid ABC transporter substrate-binding protein [Diaminobutyricimonas aerilata]PJJ71152.1 cystine transport system substrate-binding protein [Diaminobutyricimonas aerilata]